MQHNHQLIQEHQELLSNINSQIPELNQAAASINELTELCKTDQLSVEEYVELLRDISRKINIDQSMSELETLSKLNTAIHGLLTLASFA
jgi:hypothetical protein